jgi:hypothetical protein
VAQVVARELGISMELMKIIFNFVKFLASKKVWTTNFSSLLCFAVVGSEIRNPGSMMKENQDPR